MSIRDLHIGLAVTGIDLKFELVAGQDLGGAPTLERHDDEFLTVAVWCVRKVQPAGHDVCQRQQAGRETCDIG